MYRAVSIRVRDTPAVALVWPRILFFSLFPFPRLPPLAPPIAPAPSVSSSAGLIGPSIFGEICLPTAESGICYLMSLFLSMLYEEAYLIRARERFWNVCSTYVPKYASAFSPAAPFSGLISPTIDHEANGVSPRPQVGDPKQVPLTMRLTEFAVFPFTRTPFPTVPLEVTLPPFFSMLVGRTACVSPS